MTSFLYAYRDDLLGGRELKYSLRSLEKNFKSAIDLDITIVGDLPDWARGVHHIPSAASEDSGTKVKNILSAVYLGASSLAERGISSAVYCDDDYMLLEPAEAVLPMHVGPWSELYAKRNRLWEPGIDWYRTGIEATERVLSRIPEALNYELHRPMPFRTDSVSRLLASMLEKAPEDCPFWRSTYGNYAGWTYGSFLARDVRAASSWPVGSSWISTDQKHWDRVSKKLEAWFPEPSRWETS